MARSEARVSVDIWTDRDFLDLTAEAQRMFMFLISQSDIAHDGVIALRVRRWCSSARGLSASTVAAAVEELSAARFIVLDGAAEELLVRSYIRRDGVYRQPNLLRAAKKHLTLVSSPQIRGALFAELQRIRGLQDCPKASLEVIDEMLAELHANPSPNPSEKGSANPSPNPSENHSGKGSAVLTRNQGADDVSAGQDVAPNPSENPSGKGSRARAPAPSPIPYPLSPIDLPPTAGNSLTLAPRQPATLDESPATTQDLIAEWLEHCRKRPPGSVIAQVGKHVKAMLAEPSIDPSDVRAGLVAWHQKGLNPSALPSVVNELMNASARASPNGRPSTTDQRVAAALALADELDAREITDDTG